MKLLLIMVFCAIFAVKVSPPDVKQSRTELPSDLVFTMGILPEGSATSAIADTLVLLDARTLETREIYSADVVNLKPLSWSPDGEFLAVLHIYQSDTNSDISSTLPTNICVINMLGEVQSCVEATPPLYWYTRPFLIDYQFTVTWSPQGDRLYFVAESDSRWRLVEADVMTGETLRTVFETSTINEQGYVSALAWTPDLTYVATGVGFDDQVTTLSNLVTNEQHTLSEIVALNTGLVCPEFSPQGNYLSAIDEVGERIIIFDTELHTHHVIDDFGTEHPMSLMCPRWQADERVAYIPVFDQETGENILLTYSLESSRWVDQIQNTIIPPFEVSHDGTHFAFSYWHTIYILFPDGHLHDIGQEAHYFMYPVWRPIR